MNNEVAFLGGFVNKIKEKEREIEREGGGMFF